MLLLCSLSSGRGTFFLSLDDLPLLEFVTRSRLPHLIRASCLSSLALPVGFHSLRREGGDGQRAVSSKASTLFVCLSLNLATIVFGCLQILVDPTMNVDFNILLFCNDCGLEKKLGYVQQDNRMCAV